MWRVLQKVAQIVREEMNATEAQECLLPQLQPAELWQESGRWDTYTKAEGIMFALTDRQQRDLGLGPTHEEVITALAKDTIRSYRQLPLHLYQIQTKFRDEIRPRFGLMRGREFIMKDGYSFHTDEESLQKTYTEMYHTYSRILSRCGLEFRTVEADSGAIGGSGAQEFMVLAEAGEDEGLYVEGGQYAANVEKAVSIVPNAIPSPFSTREEKETPGTETIARLCEYLQCSPTQVVKNIIYEATYNTGITVLVICSIRGDREINEVKLQNELARSASNYQAQTVIALKVSQPPNKWAAKSLPIGYIGPDLTDDYIDKDKSLHPQFLRLLDPTAEINNFVTGANKTNYHIVGANWLDYQFRFARVDLQKAQAGDRSVSNPELVLKTTRGIEVGHIFQLGTKYSRAMFASIISEHGEEMPLCMGCYGLGVSRLAQAAGEQSYDKDGIIWPIAIAPYQAIVSIPNVGDAQQYEVGEKLYRELNEAGVETLLDDRNERAGVKFKDADLIGIPYRIVTGKLLKEGLVELVERSTRQGENVPIDQIVAKIREKIKSVTVSKTKNIG